MTDESTEHPMEVELKLRLPVTARAALEQHPAFRGPLATAAEERHEVTTYFDTPDLRLAGKGVSLRVRRDGDRRVQTVKLGGTGPAVAARRGEWEWPIEQDTPELGRLAETPAGALVGDLTDDGIEPVFVTDIRRTVRELRLDESTMAEAALDEGTITAGSASEAVSELELELRDGTLAPLYRLALDLQATVPLTIGPESKAERGYRLRTGRPPAARKAPDLDLDRDVGVPGAFREIVAVGLGHLLANQPAAAAGDPEGVHQMRVAIRRLRTALALFGPHLEPHATAQFEAELKRLGRVLGEARDWDVFCLDTLPKAMGDAPEASWGHLLREAAETERREAHHRAEEEIGRLALTGFVLGMAAWVEDGIAQPTLLGDKRMRRRLAKLAPELLDRLAGKVAKRGKRIGRRSDEELHALRKSLKKLRYGVDDLASLYGRKAVKTYLQGCKELQELLGRMNDATVAITLAEKLSGGDSSGLAPAAGAVAQWSEKRRGKALHHLSGAWATFRTTSPFWT
ncbi:MAG TPA: CYTH and CHAD domain-containing protein [Geminicoccaceae bacterium]|nr:CYTH and CHAD domain-containing protein [Geminicoccaceae bacterium]